MATLLAAVLMAMMAVLPALAYDTESTIPLSVTVEELYVLGITVTGSGDFGSVVQGQSISLSSPLNLTVESPATAQVDAELRNTTSPLDVLTSGLFVDNMTVSVDGGAETSVADFLVTNPVGVDSYAINATINVPIGYAVGTKDATLVFWISLGS